MTLYPDRRHMRSGTRCELLPQKSDSDGGYDLTSAGLANEEIRI